MLDDFGRSERPKPPQGWNTADYTAWALHVLDKLGLARVDIFGHSHGARVAVQHDVTSRAKYTALRSRGHSHGRALRSVADRLLNVACAMLKTGTTFNPSLAAQKTSC